VAPDQAPPASGGQEIVLDNVTKTYPDQDQPAVDRVSMTIPAGEIVVLVGPSGCGKTTTMKMINRLIEPSSGRITIGGTDVLKLDVDQHRRNIGYVIQQIGLFPHMRVRENIGLVPGLVGWGRARIAARVDELLELVGLSADYGRRYPRELSGGQQQRVGVARALAADPPVMLMDEPFGATDPITREHLQDEFRRLQLQLRKTIVFVTHDFAEALKLGDRIAVLRPQSVIAQYDTPTEILARPADAYVESFIGAGPNLKKLTLLPLRGATLEPVGRGGSQPPVVDADGSLHDALDVLLGSGSDAVAVVENGGRPLGLLRMTELLRIARGDRDDGRLARHAAGPGT
jgi:osmoprotectant transport system ATP-binding protein